MVINHVTQIDMDENSWFVHCGVMLEDYVIDLDRDNFHIRVIGENTISVTLVGKD